jgi:hypothetical protein
MSHYAKVENGIVTQVNVIDDEFFENNPERYTGFWIKTSYNTYGGVHLNPETGQPSVDQTKSLRKNFAGIGFIYDETLDAFYEPQPYESWILNSQSCLWEAPVSKPDNNNSYIWNELEQNWVEH